MFPRSLEITKRDNTCIDPIKKSETSYSFNAKTFKAIQHSILDL